MQYGSWPMPHQIQKPGFKKHLKNLRLTLSNTNDRADWIKHVLLSPRTDKSFVSFRNGSYYPSEHHVTELFDAKKKSLHPYVKRNVLEHISRSSKSDSDGSQKINPFELKRATSRRRRRASKSENFQARNSNTIPNPISQRNSKSTSKLRTRKTEKTAAPCKRFTRTMDECKRYLKELYESNKYLGLVCSSVETSNESLTKNDWPDAQQENCTQPEGASDVGEKSRENPGKETSSEQRTAVAEKKTREQYKGNCLELSNAVCPVVRLKENCLMPSKMNITFRSEMFPRQSSHMMIPQPCERQKFVETSQETLYQVKKKLESLHNVLRTYEMQNSEMRLAGKPRDGKSSWNNARTDVMNKAVSIETDNNGWNEKNKNRVRFDTAAGKHFDDLHRTVYISSEQYDSDETGRSSDVSVRSYSQVLSTYYSNNLKKSYSVDKREYSSIRYDKIPERIYYTISSDFFDNENIAVAGNFALPDVYVENTQTGSLGYLDRQTAPMDTDEDLLITSPTSSRTEMSKESESDDKSTAVLLQEALQIKRALLTRVELEKICYMDEDEKHVQAEYVSECGKCSYVDNNLQSKLLDIISEEQSISSSTDRGSRTYMFLNIKQGKQLARSSTFSNNVRNFRQQNQVADQGINMENVESNKNLGSGSEYFSINNIMQENDQMNLNQASLSEYKSCHEIKSVKSAEIATDNLRKKCQSYTSSMFNGMNEDTKLANCTKNENNENDFESNFLRMSNINELVDINNSSTEIFSQNLNDSFINEQNSSLNKNEECNFLDSDTADQRANVAFLTDVGNFVSTTLNASQNEKYIEENEILISSPNLSLKRHPGTCSLIEQTLVTENETMKLHMVINVADTMYELSASESKENSLETNLQDSSSVNQSNDSNIPEPPSTTALTNKSLDEEELNVNWSTIKDGYTDHYINEKNAQRASTNTITLQKYDYVEVEHCNRDVYNEDATPAEYRSLEVHYHENSKLKNGKDNSVMRSSVATSNNKETINVADLYKSYSNLISPQSSMYFTDDASSSAIKLNNTNSKHMETDLRSTLKNEKADIEVRYHEKNANDTENADLLFISISNDANTINKMERESYVKITNNEHRVEQKLADFNEDIDDKSKTSSENDMDSDINTSIINKTEETIKKEKTCNNETSISYDNTCNETSIRRTSANVNDKEQSNSSVNKAKLTHVDQTTALSAVSSRQVSPRITKDNLQMKNVNAMIKSKSQENYTVKSEIFKKSVASQNSKNLKSDSINIVHSTRDHNGTSRTQIKARNLSAEPRHNTDHSFKLDKKRSQSQISFRSNASSNNANCVNCTQLLDSKMKLKRLARLLTPVPKTSSRSCIPILKSRLEAARKTENESRHRSPVRGPLTMTMFWRDNLSSKSHYATEESLKLEGTSEINDQCVEEMNACEKSANDTGSLRAAENTITKTDSTITAQEQMVIYVNIFTKYDHNATKIVDPNKFLKYIKDKELNKQNGTIDVESNKNDEDLAKGTVEKKQSAMHKILTIVSSVINGNELNQNLSADLTASKANSEPLTDSLSNEKLKQLCFLSVEQREIDVTAKPSVTDTSTSITDLGNVSRPSESALSKFQICGVPKELNNDEYVALLEILYQEPNMAHLRELQTICKRLVSESQ
nr:uncharacterized protein LOC117223564 [Megalopta genalis]